LFPLFKTKRQPFKMKHIEVEFRFRIDDEKRARDFLKMLEFLGKARQKDIYLDTESREMYKRGIFIRTRNGKRLDFKFNLEDDAHEDCDEHTFSLPLSPEDGERLGAVCRTLGLRVPKAISMEGFLKANGMHEFVVIDKVREKFRDDEFTYSFDSVKGFGIFLEIESMAESGTDLASLKERMKERVRPLDPKFIPTGYIELFVREIDHDLYRQGRFLFDEDVRSNP
jgi:adenylate cyclase class IV